jgi:hypothetical protein
MTVCAPTQSRMLPSRFQGSELGPVKRSKSQWSRPTSSRTAARAAFRPISVDVVEDR